METTIENAKTKLSDIKAQLKVYAETDLKQDAKDVAKTAIAATIAFGIVKGVVALAS